MTRFWLCVKCNRMIDLSLWAECIYSILSWEKTVLERWIKTNGICFCIVRFLQTILCKHFLKLHLHIPINNIKANLSMVISSSKLDLSNNNFLNHSVLYMLWFYEHHCLCMMTEKDIIWYLILQRVSCEYHSYYLWMS